MLTTMDMGTGLRASIQMYNDYGQEILGGEWNPVLPIMCAVAAELAEEVIERNTMPHHLLEADVEAFLRKMYAAQQ